MKNLSLTEMIYQQLRRDIIAGVYEAGERLNENDLAKRHHVSRTPIRAALLSIHHEGLLEYTSHEGFRVCVIGPKDVEEIYLIREALETVATIKASEKLPSPELAENIANGLAAAERGDNAAMLQLATEFNQIIYKLADLPRLMKIRMDQHDYLLRIRNISFAEESRERSRLAMREHAQIYEAMLAKDDGAIRRLTTQHLERSKNYILEVLAREHRAALDAEA